jgi:hypothetical protein
VRTQKGAKKRENVKLEFHVFSRLQKNKKTADTLSIGGSRHALFWDNVTTYKGISKKFL